jgi:cytoskeletal protein RodZ
MAIFCYKKLQKPLGLGEILKQKRLERGWQLDDIPFRNAPIAIKYLKAIENGTYHLLPPVKSYRLAYIKEYAHVLGLNPEECGNQFQYENGLEDIKPAHPKFRIKLSFFSSWSMLIRNLALGSLVSLLVGYLTWQVKGIIDPPKLLISSPTDGFITQNFNTLVEGETEQGSRLLINGQEAAVNNKGQFSIKLNLVGGLNTITISTTKKHGKTTEKTVYVIVKPNTFTRDDSPKIPGM